MNIIDLSRITTEIHTLSMEYQTKIGKREAVEEINEKIYVLMNNLLLEITEYFAVHPATSQHLDALTFLKKELEPLDITISKVGVGLLNQIIEHISTSRSIDLSSDQLNPFKEIVTETLSNFEAKPDHISHFTQNCYLSLLYKRYGEDQEGIASAALASYLNYVENPVAKLSFFRGTLFYGSEVNAMDRNFLREHRITHILNLAGGDGKDASKEFFKDYEEFIYHSFALNDVGNELPIQKTNTILDEWLSQGQRVLVHCVEGRSRSGATIASYLMHHYHLSLSDAKKRLETAGRAFIASDSNFEIQIQRYFSMPHI
ncbi:MAG: dual specificity protein phosphatase family protein [Chlamydiales bacterium]